jgi:putative Ca2+/H+ antiporter (TMEM165/GDT1 family)
MSEFMLGVFIGAALGFLCCAMMSVSSENDL